MPNEFTLRLATPADAGPLARAAAEQPERYSLREIKLKPTVDVAELRRTVDELARQRRELDVALQAANWANSLAE